MVVESRAAIESLYEDTMWIRRFEEYLEYGVTRHREMPEEGPFPCRVSFSYGLRPGEDRDGLTTLSHDVKVFCAPEIEIPEGSVVRIERAGRTLTYRASGTPAVYHTHIEVPLRGTKGEA